ncbi:MAG: Ni/Fe hydrogenase subunit alpha [Cyanobacteriota bacterium ELA615]
MNKVIVIDPLTRIEGHAKISIYLDEMGMVKDARFHVTEFRGFERFCQARPLAEMPAITSRICGICPVSHLLASSKAADKILSVEIPVSAEKLRRLMNLAQIIQSHALSFFHLSSPDFLLGWDSQIAKRNIFGLMEANPEFARSGIRLRQFGQGIIETLGNKKIHSSCWSVPGGVNNGLSLEGKIWIKERLAESFQTITMALDLFKRLLDLQFTQEVEIFGQFPSLFMALVGDQGQWEHYGGKIRFVDSKGNIVNDNLSEDDYPKYLSEAVENWSYLKFPYYRELGYPDGIYRVGPLARLKVCDYIGTEQADRHLREFRSFGNNSSFYYHYARLIEILACLEKIQDLIEDPDLYLCRLKSQAGINQLEAVGVSEAPRGTLFHHYQVDENGLITKLNLIIATGQNNLAMNKTITQIAKHYIKGNNQISQGLLNRVEAGIRCYDPCLSCSTHALGQMPLVIELIDVAGVVVRQISR